MADTYKVLGQSRPAANALTDLYTVGAATQTSVSSLVVCNQGVQTTFRISVAVAGVVDGLMQYQAYDVFLFDNEIKTLTLGITLGATDKIRCSSVSGSVSFSAFGVEIT